MLVSKALAHDLIGSRTRLAVGAAALVILLAGCGGGGSGDTTPANPPPNIFHVIDHNGVSVSGVSVYVDGNPVPIGTTDATGSIPRNLTGVHTVDFYKAGYIVTSRVNRDWTAVTGTVNIGMGPYPDVATTGTVDGLISNTINGDAIGVRSRRSSDGSTRFLSFPLATGSPTAYSLTSAPGGAGTSDLFVIPGNISFPAGSSFIGYNAGVAVPSTVNPSVVRGTATSFSVTASGGFPPTGSINVFYGALTNRFVVGSDLILFNSASTSGATLGATTVNVPPFNLVYPNASYRLNVNAFGVPSSFGTPTGANFPSRYERRIFPTHADMVAAAATPQNIVLTNDAMVVVSPVHNAVNVSVSPTFTWSKTGTPDFVEIRLYEYDAARAFYAKFIWYAQVYGSTTSVTPPAALITLSANTSYLYELHARRNLTNSAGAFAGWQQNGWDDVKFSTGPTTPP